MSYSTISSHREMVLDHIRNSLYGEAMRELITPDSVVLDLGAGLGVHGLMAALAGAKRVYLVEPKGVVRHALDIARANGIEDRIVVLQGCIENIRLPEQVDLIVSVFTGNLLFSEDLLPSLFHARDRYLKPGGKLLPDQAQLMLAPVNTPMEHGREISCWSTPNAELDFSVLRPFAANELISVERSGSLPALLAPALVAAEIDLGTAVEAACNSSFTVQITRAGNCHGLLGWIRIRLGNQWLSSGLDSPAVHWAPMLLPLDPPLQLVIGDTLDITLRRPEFGEWSWTVTTRDGSRRHSTFHACYAAPEQFLKISPHYDKRLDGAGLQALEVLSLMQAGVSNARIAEQLADQFPDQFANTLQALRFVQELALKYR